MGSGRHRYESRWPAHAHHPARPRLRCARRRWRHPAKCHAGVRRRAPECELITEVEIAALNVTGDGIAASDGRRLAVPFTIPGERVRVRVERRAGRPTTTLLEILRPSPHRVTPRCRHFGVGAEPGPGAC